MPRDKVQTYLRWVGGKRRIASRLRRFVPYDYAGRRYHEPFLGAASLFLALRPARAYLSDLNEALIGSFQHVRARPDLIARYLSKHAESNSRDHYYKVRDQYNRTRRFSSAQAARFIYLNRTCYNGVFRVNREGRFNVPYGKRDRFLFPSRTDLVRVSHALKDAKFRTRSYERSLEEAKEGDFVYLDPPYPPLNGTSYFRHYTADRFSSVDQENLARMTKELRKRGCLVMVSNADTAQIRDLYSGLSMASLPVTRSVTCKSVRHTVSELVITTYEEAEMLGASRDASAAARQNEAEEG
ncbi:DNA adenine methylase [Candidatus Palauibacter sp.]|uniref:DNA adenine methylase n=1 Tax=Candidatus Palauibacter sp. TaxID=3101350 RepID=UPI003B014D4E